MQREFSLCPLILLLEPRCEHARSFFPPPLNPLLDEEGTSRPVRSTSRVFDRLLAEATGVVSRNGTWNHMPVQKLPRLLLLNEEGKSRPVRRLLAEATGVVSRNGDMESHAGTKTATSPPHTMRRGFRGGLI